MDVLFAMVIFRLYPGSELSFQHKSARKNLLLGACFCWGSLLSLRKMDGKNHIGGTIGYRDSYL